MIKRIESWSELKKIFERGEGIIFNAFGSVNGYRGKTFIIAGGQAR